MSVELRKQKRGDHLLKRRNVPLADDSFDESDSESKLVRVDISSCIIPLCKIILAVIRLTSVPNNVGNIMPDINFRETA